MSLPVRGDSMSPALSDGDMAVCDGGDSACAERGRVSEKGEDI